MKETRIPYSLPMARARRAGIKTQTRRMVKPQPCEGVVHGFDDFGRLLVPTYDGMHLVACPYGKPGDILLPVEPWRAPAEFDKRSPIDIPAGTPISLDASGPAPEGFGRYRHARFMPKHLIAARDELVAVRVQQLQDISEADAEAEGVYTDPACPAYDAYSALWERLNGPGSWGANPWVWVLESKVINL